MAALSIITLTCNRFAHLERLWEKLHAQLGPADEWLVLDTGSTDGTREKFASHSDPRIRFLIYGQSGSWAEIRNLGVRTARGNLLAFLDDDCLPADDWAARGKAHLLEVEGGCDAVGGMARPHGISRFPPWWHPTMGWMAGLSVPAHASPLANRVAYPFTANLFVRASVARAEPFQELGGALGGPEAERYASGREDAEWWRRLRTRGYATRFDPDLWVGHGIDPARLDLKYLRRRAALDGQAWAIREGNEKTAHEDIDEALYLAWHELAQMGSALFREDAARLGKWHLHRLQRVRQNAAARRLAIQFKNYSEKMVGWRLVPRQIITLGRYGHDRTKAFTRELLTPLLRPKISHPGRRPVERLGVIAFGYLGDLIILQSVLRGLMEEHPTLEIYVLAPPAAAVALDGLKRLNLTLLPTAQPDPGAREFLSTWLERLAPDALVAPYLHAPWGNVLTRLRRLPCPVFGFDADHTLARQWQLERLQYRVHKDTTRHEAENLRNLFAAMDLPCVSLPARLVPAEAPAARARAHAVHTHVAARGGKLIMLNPDAGQPYKEWSDEHWSILILQLLSETPHCLAINCSKSHPELEKILQDAPTQVQERIVWLRGISLLDLAAWLSTCGALITVDAGPQHLAHALDVSSLTLYGPMDERRWSDYFKRPIHRTLRGCACDLTPEEKRSLPLNQEMLCITPEYAWKELKELFSAENGQLEPFQPPGKLTFGEISPYTE